MKDIIDFLSSSLVTNIITIISIVSGFVFYFYKKSPSLSIDWNGSNIILYNKKETSVVIRNIRLVKRDRLKFCFEPNSFYHVYPSDIYGIQSTQDDPLNIEVKPNDLVKELQIDYRNLKSLYDYFLPYEYENSVIKKLNKPTKMIKCYIAIYLTSGNVKYTPLPADFYDFYRDSFLYEYSEDFKIFSGESKVRINFQTKDSKYFYKENLLSNYEISRRNYYYLYK
ncbi:hypothetical protein [Photobacterium leiognathi]|uniref:hypothetical protein n=1 Tax=Photobacterium leiognathi TaxID=553611 RepID=UPI002980C0D0|nr:hypothetical protein [Photobacterium leiognathi]